MDYNIKDVCVNLDEQLRNSVSTIDNFFRSPEFSAITEGIVTDKWSCSLVDGSVVVDFGSTGGVSFTPISSSSRSSGGILRFDTVRNIKGTTKSLSLSNSVPDVRSDKVVTQSIVSFFGRTFKDVLIDILSSSSLKSLPNENIKSAYNRIVTSNIIKSIKGVVSPADLISYFSCYSIALKVNRVASWLEDLTKLSVMFTFVDGTECLGIVERSATTQLLSYRGIYRSPVSVLEAPSFKTKEEVFNWIKKVAKTKGCVVKKR